MKKLFILAAILIGLPAFAGSRNIDITKVGARESNKDNAAVIQKAIDKVSSLGGGTVVVPAGKFVSIQLKCGGLNTSILSGSAPIPFGVPFM